MKESFHPSSFPVRYAASQYPSEILLAENLIPLGHAVLHLSEERFGGIRDGDGLNLITLSNGVHDVLTLGHFTEDRVLAIQMRGRKVGDEELAAIRLRAGVRHAQDTRFAVLQRWVDLVFKLVARTARARARRIAALDHEILDHAVELHAVIVAVLGEVQEVRCRERHFGGEDHDVDIALIRFDDDVDVLHVAVILGR